MFTMKHFFVFDINFPFLLTNKKKQLSENQKKCLTLFPQSEQGTCLFGCHSIYEVPLKPMLLQRRNFLIANQLAKFFTKNRCFLRFYALYFRLQRHCQTCWSFFLCIGQFCSLWMLDLFDIWSEALSGKVALCLLFSCQTYNFFLFGRMVASVSHEHIFLCLI